MNINEILMRAGNWSALLVPSTPISVLDEVRNSLGFSGDLSAWDAADGHIVVLPVYERNTSLIEGRIDEATYVGRVTFLASTTDAGYTLSGSGLASWIGSPGVPAAWAAGTESKTNGTLDQWITTLLGATYANGITKGTIGNPGTFTGVWHASRIVEAIDSVTLALGAEWRINNDGTLDADVPTTLFTSPPEVMFAPGISGEVSGTVRGISDYTITSNLDASHLTNTVHVAGDGEGTGLNITTETSSKQVAYGYDGTTPIRLDQVVDDATLTTTKAREETAENLLDQYDVPRLSFSINVIEDRVRELFGPGDYLYVYDRRNGVYDTSQAQVLFRGQPTWPVTIRCQAMRYNVTDGHGVYLWRKQGSTSTFTDLTPYMVWPTRPAASLDLGASEIRDNVLIPAPTTPASTPAPVAPATPSGLPIRRQGRYAPAVYERANR